MMTQLSRRSFLKGLFTTAGAAAVLGPQVLDPTHGASDLTPQERDVVADVLGLRGRLWQIDKPWRGRTVRIPIFTGQYWPDGSPCFGEWEVPAEKAEGVYERLSEYARLYRNAVAEYEGKCTVEVYSDPVNGWQPLWTITPTWVGSHI